MKLLLLFLLSLSLYGGLITPKKTVKTSSPILDVALYDKTLWAGSANGEVIHFDTKGKILSTVTLPSRVDSWGEKVIPKVMSLDVSSDGSTVAVGSDEGKVFLIRNQKIVPTSYMTYGVIKKIAFISDKRLMIALLSNEVVWFDIDANKVVKTISVGTSPLSDMALSKDKKIAAVAGEAGVISLIDTAKMAVMRQIRGGNVDNIYDLDIQNGSIITAGQDRRAILYTMDGKSYVRYNGSFLIYAAALSPSARVMGAALDEENRLSFYDTQTRQKIATAKGHTATLNRIVFIDEKNVVSCADENKILYWELP